MPEWQISRMRADQVETVAAFISRLQLDVSHYIAYFDTLEQAIAETMWDWHLPNGALIAEQQDKLIGVLGVDMNPATGRAWLHGPLIDSPEWDAIADALYTEAHRSGLIPASTREEELFADEANTRVMAFAAGHGFSPGIHNASLHFDRRDIDDLPVAAARELLPEEYPALQNLHDSIFPDAYYTGAQLIERLNDRNKIFVLHQDDAPVGYGFAQVDGDEGYIDFVGVAEPVRRKGIGRQLIAFVTRWLFTFPEVRAVRLTVSADNTAALNLYRQLGYTHQRTLVAFRKQL
jgi:ribosomal protein S18 acetylase RimI-like enzyme